MPEGLHQLLIIFQRHPLVCAFGHRKRIPLIKPGHQRPPGRGHQRRQRGQRLGKDGMGDTQPAVFVQAKRRDTRQQAQQGLVGHFQA